MFDKIPLILPAAGKSSRLGTPKGLKTLGDKTWLEIQCESFRQLGGQQVLLILGFDHEPYLSLLGIDGEQKIQPLEFAGCELIPLLNPLPEYGPFSSLQCACRRLLSQSNVPAAFFLPIDVPIPDSEVFRGLLSVFEPSQSVVEPRFEDRGGHPVLLSRHFMSEIVRLDPALPDSRLDFQVRDCRATGTVKSIAVQDPNILLNLNDPAAWKAYLDIRNKSLQVSENSSSTD
jgi:CTP:molybdopterin cytidylyltransferase MocA